MIKKLFKGGKLILKRVGIDIDAFLTTTLNMPWYIKDLLKFKKGNTTNWPMRLYPILNNKNEQSGTLSYHYFYQDLHVAQEIFKMKPIHHIDIGSRVDGFIAHVASFMPISIIDIRPLEINNSQIDFIKLDITSPTFATTDQYESVSCLHTIEHFGLGRYGDPISNNSYEHGFNNMSKLVKKGGVFYFSTQIGKQIIEFNAHRIFNIQTLLDLILPQFTIEQFSYINDKNELFTNVGLTPELIASSYNCKNGCGIFILRKR